MAEYDYLIIGSGLFGSTFARIMTENKKKVLIIDKRNHVGGNVYTEEIEGIKVHQYGPHIFHTKSNKVWLFINQFAQFNHYQHRVKATYRGKIYSLPFNLMTFYQMWGCTSPEEAKKHLESQRVNIEDPQNLEEFALATVGPDIYHTLIYGYTKKQWKRYPKYLPASIIKRIPVRLTFNDNYFDDPYQGIPINGYAKMIENMLDGIDVKLNSDFYDIKDWRKIADKLVYSGSIDQFFDFQYGELEYRTLRFETEVLDTDNFQGIGQMNYTDDSVPYTRIIEHKHFYFQNSSKTVITREYPEDWKKGSSPHLPINDEKNNKIYQKYADESKKHPDILIGGRLGKYKYYNMDQVIGQAISMAEKELNL